MSPAGVMRPITSRAFSVNQRLPSDPAVIPTKPLLTVGTGNSVMAPEGLIRPILLSSLSVNQRLPSGPAMISVAGPDGKRRSLMLPVDVISPITELDSFLG